MKNKKRTITLSVLILVMVLSLTYVVTNIGAWLTDQKDTGKISISVGEVRYELKNPNIFVTGPVVPGQDIVAGNTLTITNHSTVSSQLRFKYEFTITKKGETEVIEISEDLIAIVFSDTWSMQEGSDDGYYYLVSYDHKEPAAIESSLVSYGVVNTMKINGETFGNEYAGATIKLTIIFEAKQAEHLTWEGAGSIDFEKGLAA